MLYSIYRTLTSFSSPVLKNLVQKRLAIGKEKADRYTERFGEASIPRPQGKVLWLHGASVGESLSALPLLNTLKTRLPDWNFLVTTGTVTSADVMAQRLPEWAIHQFVPLDHPVWVKRFMDHWRPDAVVWLESELWPNILHEFRERNIPAGLINARMRPKTFAKWQYAKGFASQMLGAFTFILVGARDYIRYFQSLGGKNISYVGSLKFGAKALPVDAEKLAALKMQIGMRPCLGFLQTHPTEDVFAAETYKELKKILPDLLLIVAPRKNTRGMDIKKELDGLGFKTALRTADESIKPDTEIYIADTIGEMSLWYTLCSIAVIGGSFIPFGGQNPLEGTHFGTAILYGPSMFNFPELCAVLEGGKAAKTVPSRDALVPVLKDLYEHPQKLQDMKAASSSLAEQNHAVIDAFAEEIILQLVQR